MAPSPSLLDRVKNLASGIGLGRLVTASDRFEDPYADPAGSKSSMPVQKGKVFQRWTYPFRGYSMPILEVPSNRVQRYLLAFEYFTTDPIVNAAIRIKTEFALSGMDFDVIIEEDEWPDWVKADYSEWIEEYEKLVEEEKTKSGQLDASGPPIMPHPATMPASEEPGAPKTKPVPGLAIAADGNGEGTPTGARKPSPAQDQPQVTDVGRNTDKTQWQPGQDMPAEQAVPPTNLTPIHQFVSNKIKLELARLSVKLDLQSWIINYSAEAMLFGDGFANIVDGWEMDDGDGGVNEEVLTQILDHNDQLEEIRKRYAQAYEQAKPESDYLDRIKTAVNVIFRGTAASLSVDPSLLKDKEAKKAMTVEKWHAEKGLPLYNEFLATAKKRDELVRDKRYTIAEIQTLNPSAVWVTRNDVGEVILMELVKRIGVDASPLNIPDIIHWKWQGPEWMTYGISDFFPAFRHLKLKRTLEEALAANAERYANPIIQMKVGTDKVTRLQVPSQEMIDQAAALLSEYDRKSVLTTPYHWQIEIHGMDGKPLRIDYPLTYANEQTIAVLGIPKTFLWGDGGNFASVRAQFQTMIFRLKKMQNDASRIITTRIFNRFLERRGWLTVNGKLPEIKMKWAQQELDGEQSVIGLINAFSNLAKSVGSPELPISFTTLLDQLGHNYEQEMYRKGREKAMMRKMQDGQVGQPPNQVPQKEPPSRAKQLLRGVSTAAIAEDVRHLSWTRPEAFGAKRRRNSRKAR